MGVLAHAAPAPERRPIIDQHAHLFKSFQVSILFKMKIAVVGTGYVGLVVGACLAENGNDVICIDKDQAKIDTLLAGQMPIYEPGLEEMVRRNHAEDRLKFDTDLPA